MADCGSCGEKVAKSTKAPVISASCGITCLVLG